MMRAYN